MPRTNVTPVHEAVLGHRGSKGISEGLVAHTGLAERVHALDGLRRALQASTRSTQSMKAPSQTNHKPHDPRTTLPPIVRTKSKAASTPMAAPRLWPVMYSPPEVSIPDSAAASWSRSAE